MLTKKPKNAFELYQILLQSRKFITYAYLGLALLYVALFLGFVFFVYHGFQKPPILIRDFNGTRSVQEDYINGSNSITDQDVYDFTKLFLDNYYALRSDYVIPQLERSLNMMSDSYKEHHIKTFEEHQTIKQIQSAGIINEIRMNPDVKYEDFGKEYLVNTKGIIVKKLIGSDERSERKFICNLKLIKIPISKKYPYGLVVDNVDMRFLEQDKKIDESLKEAVKK